MRNCIHRRDITASPRSGDGVLACRRHLHGMSQATALIPLLKNKTTHMHQPRSEEMPNLPWPAAVLDPERPAAVLNPVAKVTACILTVTTTTSHMNRLRPAALVNLVLKTNACTLTKMKTMENKKSPSAVPIRNPWCQTKACMPTMPT